MQEFVGCTHEGPILALVCKTVTTVQPVPSLPFHIPGASLLRKDDSRTTPPCEHNSYNLEILCLSHTPSALRPHPHQDQPILSKGNPTPSILAVRTTSLSTRLRATASPCLPTLTPDQTTTSTTATSPASPLHA
ncbi:hypothetical protein CRENBAI_017164 [Crenichthys baileyi]|uniref:Uncharacterized protein n=1 Tax=Crenichthys baileyi TaxID=28760 RepID=A0AAV9RQR9_9TELE